MGKLLTTEIFIKRSIVIHKNKYDYSLVNYKNSRTKVKIICPIHGEFEQLPNNHLTGQICNECFKKSKLLTNEIFIKRSNIIHNNKYDYSLVEYKNNKTKVKIICPIHGEFEQQPSKHLGGGGCRKCSILYKTLSLSEFIKKSKEMHGDKYDYSLVEYKNSQIKVKIICPIHGIFNQTPNSHLYGKGCKICTGLNKLTSNEFIKKSKKIHGDKYDYSLVKYRNGQSKVKIICPKHGEFNQIANNHTSKKYGCPICKESKGETIITQYLDNLNIKYHKQKIFDKCKNKNFLPFDFYLPEHNVCIEYDGLQHYEPIEFFGGIDSLKKYQKNDKIKNEYCKKNNIHLIRIKYDENINEKIHNLLVKELIS